MSSLLRRLSSCWSRDGPPDVAIGMGSVSEVEQREFILKASEGDEFAVSAFLQLHGNTLEQLQEMDDFRVKGLVKAAEKGHTAVMRLILSACQNHPLFRRLAIPALHEAAWTGAAQDTILQELDAGADVNVGTPGGLTALHLASSSGQLHVVQLLLQRPQVKVDCVSDEGLTALHLAANGGHSAVANALLAACPEPTRGAFLNAKDALGRTALHYAARKGHDSVVRGLLRIQAPEQVELLANDRVGATAFLLATMMPGDHVEVVRLLLERDLDQISAKVERSGTAIDETFLNEVDAGHEWKILRPQLVDKTDKAGVRAPFRVGDFELKQGDDDDDRLRSRGVCIAGHTPLHLAASQNNVRVVAYLLQQPNVDVNARDHTFGMTPLHCAVRTAALDSIKVLLKLPQSTLDVNAQLVSGGPIPNRWREMEEWEIGETQLETGELEKGDTALHLAIRFGPCTEALATAIELVRLTHLKASTRSGSTWITPLELAWERWRVADAGESSVPTASEVLITIISEHPDMQVVVEHLKEMREGLKTTFSGLLVGGTLLAGITFGGFLQPPSPGEYKAAVKWFWIFDSMSFFSAIYTVFLTLAGVLPRERSSSIPVMVTNMQSSYWQLHFLVCASCVAMLTSMLTGMAAFVSLGFANSPPQIQGRMLSTTIWASCLVLLGASYFMGRFISSGIGLFRVSRVTTSPKSSYTRMMRKCFAQSVIELMMIIYKKGGSAKVKKKRVFTNQRKFVAEELWVMVTGSLMVPLYFIVYPVFYYILS